MKQINSVLTRVLLLSVSILILPAVTFAQQYAVIDGKMVVFGEDANGLWVIKRKLAPDYPMKALRKEMQGCVSVGYVINANGKTSDHRILVNNGSSVFDDSAIEAAKKFFYTPSEENPERIPVLTFNTFTYQVGNRKDMKAEYKDVSEACSSAAKGALEALIAGSGTEEPG